MGGRKTTRKNTGTEYKKLDGRDGKETDILGLSGNPSFIFLFSDFPPPPSLKKTGNVLERKFGGQNLFEKSKC